MFKKQNLSGYSLLSSIVVFGTTDIQNDIINNAFIKTEVPEDWVLNFAQKREWLNSTNERNLVLNSSDYSLRDDAVREAWKYEQKNVELGGDGITHSWTDSEKRELIETGRVSGYDGHHINDVSTYPELQADPNNITFLTKEEHILAHNGNFRNYTNGEVIDKIDNLGNVHSDGLAMFDIALYSLAIGAVPFTIELLVRAYKNNLSYNDLRNMGINNLKTVVQGTTVMGGALLIDNFFDCIDYISGLFIARGFFRFSQNILNGANIQTALFNTGKSLIFPTFIYMTVTFFHIPGVLIVSLLISGNIIYKFFKIEDKSERYIIEYSKPVFI
jgi:hypothetical protein